MSIEAMKQALEALTPFSKGDWTRELALNAQIAITALRTAIQQPASEEHLFEFWWEAHMPNANKENAWSAFTAAIASNRVGIAAQQPATPEPVAALVRHRRLRTPADCAFDKKDHYSDWSDWEPTTLSCALAVTDPARDKGLLPLYEMMPLYTRPAPGVPEGFALVPLKATPKVAMVLYEGARSCFSPKVAEGLWQDALAASQVQKGGE